MPRILNGAPIRSSGRQQTEMCVDTGSIGNGDACGVELRVFARSNAYPRGEKPLVRLG